jgi:hypothetical protein
MARYTTSRPSKLGQINAHRGLVNGEATGIGLAIRGLREKRWSLKKNLTFARNSKPSTILETDMIMRGEARFVTNRSRKKQAWSHQYSTRIGVVLESYWVLGIAGPVIPVVKSSVTAASRSRVDPLTIDQF